MIICTCIFVIRQLKFYLKVLDVKKKEKKETYFQVTLIRKIRIYRKHKEKYKEQKLYESIRIII